MASMSKLQIGEFCPAALADVTSDMEEPSGNVERKLGRAFHAVVARLVNNPNLGSGPAHVLDSYLKAEGLDPEQHRAALFAMRPFEQVAAITKTNSTVEAEVAYALDLTARTARQLGNDIGRKYKEAGLLDHEIPGSTDLRRLEEKGLVVVVSDWKTGAIENVTAIDDNLQIGTLCLAAYYDYYNAVCNFLAPDEVVRVRGEIRYVSWDGVCRVESREYDEFDLADIAARVEAIWSGRNTAEPVPGDHCTKMWCKRINSCPVAKKTVETALATQPAVVRRLPQLPSGLPSIVSSPDQIVSVEHASSVLALTRLLKTIYERNMTVLQAYSQSAPIPVSKGEQWGPIRRTKEVVDSPRSEAIVEALMPILPPHAIPAPVASITMEALKDGCGKAADPGKAGELLRRCKNALRRASLVREVSTVEYRDHKPGREEKDEKSEETQDDNG